jgi:hypothetical protein
MLLLAGLIFLTWYIYFFCLPSDVEIIDGSAFFFFCLFQLFGVICCFFPTVIVLLQDWIVQYDPPDNPKVITSPSI